MAPTVRQFKGLSFQSIVDALWLIISDLIIRLAQVLGVGGPGSKHFKLCIVSHAMPAGKTDGIVPSGIRGDGACSFYAVFLGYIDAYGDAATISDFEDFMTRLQTGLDEWSPTGFDASDKGSLETLNMQKDEMRREIREALDGTLSSSNHLALFYDLMAKSLNITIRLKVTRRNSENPEGPPETISRLRYNPNAVHTVFLSTNDGHVNLYLSQRPFSPLFLSTFHRMWTEPAHPKLTEPSVLGAELFKPELSFKENWRYSPAK